MRHTDDKSGDARAANNDDHAEDESPNQPADTESDTMTDDTTSTDADDAALAEDLDATTLQNIADRHDDYDDRESAITGHLKPREGARSVNPEDDATREAYATLELYKIDDEELIADLIHASVNVGDSLEGTRRDDIRWAADRRMEELCNDDKDPLVTPTDDESTNSDATHTITDDKPRDDRGIVKAEYFVNDEAFQIPTTELPGIGQKTAETLAEKHDVETIADVLVAKIDNRREVFDEIAEYEGLHDTLDEYVDYDRQEAYPVNADTYDGPHEFEDWYFFDIDAPVYVERGDRVRLRIDDNEVIGEAVSVDLKCGNTVWMDIDADDDFGSTYTMKYERGEWTWVFNASPETIEVEFLDDEESDNEKKELVTDGGQPVETDVDSTTEIPTPSYDLSIITTDRDRDTGVRYLSLVEDEARVHHIADDYEVLADDLQRVIYALGASLDHTVHTDEEDVIYTDDDYTVTADVSHRHAVEETVSREIDDDHALDTERELAKQYDVDPDSIEDEKAIAHYRDQLCLATLAVMRAVDGSEHGYPVGYPLVILDGEK